MRHFNVIQAKFISLFDNLSQTQSVLLNPHFSEENSPDIQGLCLVMNW